MSEKSIKRARKALGLRTTTYEQLPDQHPDMRPCPSWCFVAEDGKISHEVDAKNITSACHSTDILAMQASCYPGKVIGTGKILSASIETYLRQQGQAPPGIRVGLRYFPTNDTQEYLPILRLTIEDADELSRVLAHWVEVARAC